MPKMPPPPNVPLYWQLTSITHEPEIYPTGRYTIHYDVSGLGIDLEDGLMAESLLNSDDAAQSLTLIVNKGDEVVMEHAYIWNPLPIYLEPETTYPITVIGCASTNGNTPNSLLGIYVQGDLATRVSAGGYTSHETSETFDIDTTNDIYKDGSIVVSFILRDVNDMFRDRIVFTYEMKDGIKPVPTPVPGFSSAELSETVEVPAYYAPVEGKENLWRIITAPEEYRSYGTMTGSEPAFFPADANGNVIMDERPADPDGDFTQHVQGFVADIADEVPAEYTVTKDGTYTFTTRDGETVTRAYGRIDGGAPAFYPAEADGSVDVEAAAPVTPEADFETHIKGFGVATPEAPVPGHYTQTDDTVYTFKARDGETYFRAYGRLNGAAPAYYPADEDGTVAEDAQPVDPQTDFDDLIKGFDSMPYEGETPPHYTKVDEGLYSIEDREGNPVYRVYGIKDGQAPAFYPADEAGTLQDEEAAQPVAPTEDFDAYVAGFEPVETTDVPDFYAPAETAGVWSFTDKDGNVQYRVYGKLHRGTPSFYPADEAGQVTEDALPVEPAADLATMPPPVFVPLTPNAEDVPFYYTPVTEDETVHSFTNTKGDTNFRAYGSYGRKPEGFYPADEDGMPADDSAPVDQQREYTEHFGTFTPETPAEVPARYTIVEGKEGLYTFTNRQQEPVYRVFGKTENGDPAFYPADAEGNIISGIPASPAQDLDMMPSVVSSAIVVTPAPEPEAINTPLVRMQEAGTTRWTDPNAPQPTQYIATIKATDVPGSATQPVETRLITPTPEASAEALPTSYEATVVPQTGETSQPQVVAQTVTKPAATEAQTTEATTEAGTDAPTETETTDPATTTPETTESTTSDATTATTEETEEPTATEAPTEAPSPVPTEAPVAAAQASSLPWWAIMLIGAGVIGVGGGGYYLIKRKK